MLLAAAISELSVALSRRIEINGAGIHLRYSTWPLPRPKFLPRIEGQRARVQKLRLRNSVTYASGRVSHAPIRKDRFMVKYGTGWIGPFDEDQVEKLADSINIALEETAPQAGPAEL